MVISCFCFDYVGVGVGDDGEVWLFWHHWNPGEETSLQPSAYFDLAVKYFFFDGGDFCISSCGVELFGG